MRFLLLVFLLLGTLTWGQQTTVPPEFRPALSDSDDQEAPVSASKVAPDAAVLTIRGLCDETPSTQTASNQTCETIITRAQFENLADAILTNMKPAMKRQIAEVYPDLLAMAREAEARGLENSPRFQERIRFARVQILSQELIRQIDEQAANIPEKDIEEYYHRHLANFENVTLERIFVPLRTRMDPLPKDQATPAALAAQKKEGEEAMRRVAEQLRTKAVAGEAFMQLQKEAYAAAEATEVPPNPSLGQVTSSSLPSSHASVLELKPGEVSQVFSDSAGRYIYKLDSKATESLGEVTDEIRNTLQNQHRGQVIQAVKRPISTQINEAYFGSTGKSTGHQSSKSR